MEDKRLQDRQFLLSLVGGIERFLDDKFSKLSKTLGNVQPAKVKIEKADFDLKEVTSSLTGLKKTVSSIKIPETGLKEVVSALNDIKTQVELIPEVEIPEPIAIPSKFSIAEGKDIISALKEVQKDIKVVARGVSKKKDKIDLKPLSKGIKALEKAIKEIPTMEFPSTVSIDNFPPQKIPQPVTHVSINSLSGLVHSTSTVVKTTVTQLPEYGVLDNRRSIVFYNNSDDTVIYIGGSGVTEDNGLPIEAKSFSPSFDSGSLQRWYGVTSTGTANVRCIEIPDEASGR